MKANHTRLIITEYHGASCDRASRSATIDGALRAAVLKVARRDYDSAVIFDERFGSHTQALKVGHSHRGLTIIWVRVPKWGAT